MSLENKVVIITGAAQGIGLACAWQFAEKSAKVVLADCHEEKGEEACKDLKSAGHDVLFVCGKVEERLDVRNLMAHTLDVYKGVDVLINNAAILDHGEFLDLKEEEFERVLNVNLKGYFLIGQAVARQMVKQIEKGDPPGTIINMSSINQQVALSGHLAYSVSKGGIQQLTKSMALALAPYGIRVNAIGPGSIKTAILDEVMGDEKGRQQILSRTPLGRAGTPREIAAIAEFLASDSASYMTGETIYADGGRLALNYTIEVSDDP